jgi:cbb3-type cytochrome oxidase subunit 1
MSSTKDPRPAPAPAEPAHLRLLNDPTVLMKRHLRFGWWSLLVFLSLGLVLEALHGFKVPQYLNVSNETRRLMWTLAHAHGTLLGLVNLAFALSVRLLPEWAARERGIASVCLRASTWLMPAGFFFGGVWIHGADPGLAILLVPAGGLLLLVAVFLTACGVATFRIEMHGDRPGKRR